MDRRAGLDGTGLALLCLSALLFGLNQVVIKTVNSGLQPVFFAGLRSLGAAGCIYLWMRWRGRRLDFTPGTILAGILAGLIFAAEFLALFVALDLTSVVRASIIFYSMPIWLAALAHFLLPGERASKIKAVGLALAFAGVAWALLHRGGDTAGTAAAGPMLTTHLLGDLLALAAAWAWAGVALMARISPLRRVAAEMQLFWMVAVSGPVLLALAPWFGPLVRDLRPIDLWGLAFQIVAVVSFGFILWLWLLGRYSAATVTSFSFLTPLLSMAFGWLLLGESLNAQILAAGALVLLGLVLITRPEKAPPPS